MSNDVPSSGQVIEFLTFEVEPRDQKEFLAVEEQIWTRALEKAPGFIRKERWSPDDDPRTVHAVIWWESLELWKSFPAEEVERLDAAMGSLLRAPTCRTFNVIGE